MAKTDSVVVIGNGIAGNSACVAIRELDSTVPITLVSAEDTPAYSACVLAYYLGGDIPRSRVFIRNPGDYERLGINRQLGQEVVGLDVKERKIFLSHKTLGFDRLIMAMGSEPVLPPVIGKGLKGVFTFKTLADVESIMTHKPQKAVVIGAGPVGIEAAVGLRKMGVQVYLIDVLSVLPQAFDEKASELIKSIMERNGVKVFTFEKVKSIEGGGKIKKVVTDKRSIDCDTIVVATGMRPNVKLAKIAGIKVGDLGGIEVNQYLETSIEGTYACGDCIESWDVLTQKRALNLLWANAREQGRLAGMNCLGKNKAYAGSANVRSFNVFGEEAASFGYTASALRDKTTELVEKQTTAGYYRLVFRDGKLAGGQWIGSIRNTGHFMELMRKSCPEALQLTRKYARNATFAC